MKKVIIFLFVLVLMSEIMVGCSSNQKPAPQKTEEQIRAEVKAEMEAEAKKNEGEKKTSEAPKESAAEKPAQESAMKETINGVEVDYGKYEAVIIRDYKGKYLDKLKKKEIKSEYAGSATYTIAVFGDIKNVSFMAGKYGSGGAAFLGGEENISNSLITLKDAPGKDLFVGMFFYDSSDENYTMTILKDGDSPESPNPMFIEKKQTPKAEVKSQPQQPEKAANPLIESDQEQGSTTYYKYKANAAVNFDIDEDGKKEEIKYDSVNGKLNITGYDAIDIDTMFAQKDYFIIAKFSDRFDNKMNMIGIVDYGPSKDIVTNLYSIIQPMEKKSFVSVGSVPGELIPESKYDESSMDDFNYKAVLKSGQGIEAPVKLSILPNHTWFGRNIFTYYTTYCSLIDNIEKYNLDYKTRSELNVVSDVKVYSDKDLNSESTIIRAGETIYFVATDNKEWISLGTEGGVAGWVNVKDVTEVNFSGFAVFD